MFLSGSKSVLRDMFVMSECIITALNLPTVCKNT